MHFLNQDSWVHRASQSYGSAVQSCCPAQDIPLKASLLIAIPLDSAYNNLSKVERPPPLPALHLPPFEFSVTVTAVTLSLGMVQGAGKMDSPYQSASAIYKIWTLGKGWQVVFLRKRETNPQKSELVSMFECKKLKPQWIKNCGCVS